MMDENKLTMLQTDAVGEDKILESLRRELRMTRIFNGIVSILLVCVLLGGVLFYVRAQKYAEQVRPLTEKLAMVDYEVLNETMSSLNTSLNEIDWSVLSEGLSEVDWKQLSEDLEAIDWEKLSEQLSELDMEALNDAIAGLDTEELSATLKNLNNTADAMKSFSDSLKAFFAKLGIGNTEADA